MEIYALKDECNILVNDCKELHIRWNLIYREQPLLVIHIMKI